MSFRNRFKDRETMQGTNAICLTPGLLLPYRLHPVSNIGNDALHAFCGLMPGIYIAINLRAAICRQRRCGGN